MSRRISDEWGFEKNEKNKKWCRKKEMKKETKAR